MFFGGQGRVRLGVISTCSGMQMCDIYSMSVCFIDRFFIALVLLVLRLDKVVNCGTWSPFGNC